MKKKNDQLVFLAIASELIGFVLVLTYLGYLIESSHPMGGFAIGGGAFLGLTLWVVRIVYAMKDME